MTEAKSGRTAYPLVLVTGLLAATAVTAGASKPWVEATAMQPDLPTIEASVEGTRLAPLAGAMGWVLLAAFGAVVATRGWARRAIGVVIVTAAVVVFVTAMRPGDETQTVREALSARGWSGGDYVTQTQGWRWLVAGGAALSLLAGSAVIGVGSAWATMGSRYDAPVVPSTGSPAHPQIDAGPPASVDTGATRAALTDADVWRALDQGHDPTQHS